MTRVVHILFLFSAVCTAMGLLHGCDEPGDRPVAAASVSLASKPAPVVHEETSKHVLDALDRAQTKLHAAYARYNDDDPSLAWEQEVERTLAEAYGELGILTGVTNGNDKRVLALARGLLAMIGTDVMRTEMSSDILALIDTEVPWQSYLAHLIYVNFPAGDTTLNWQDRMRKSYDRTDKLLAQQAPRVPRELPAVQLLCKFMPSKNTLADDWKCVANIFAASFASQLEFSGAESAEEWRSRALGHYHAVLDRCPNTQIAEVAQSALNALKSMPLSKPYLEEFP